MTNHAETASQKAHRILREQAVASLVKKVDEMLDSNAARWEVDPSDSSIVGLVDEEGPALVVYLDDYDFSVANRFIWATR